jgi:hypothetical protein
MDQEVLSSTFKIIISGSKSELILLKLMPIENLRITTLIKSLMSPKRKTRLIKGQVITLLLKQMETYLPMLEKMKEEPC